MAALQHLAALAGLAAPLPQALLFALPGLGIMLVYGPAADWIATRLVAAPPRLKAFRALKESRTKLFLGIVVAWILGGFLEELLLRGAMLQVVEAGALRVLPPVVAAALGILAAAAFACVLHLYQGPRAALIVAQLSVLFGLLFVISGYNLWSVILCHGLYDTVAFIRFATGASRYSKFDGSGE